MTARTTTWIEKPKVKGKQANDRPVFLSLKVTSGSLFVERQHGDVIGADWSPVDTLTTSGNYEIKNSGKALRFTPTGTVSFEVTQ